MSTSTNKAARHVVLQRVYSEFLEMPCLCLTGRQAQRLWGLDEATCLELLEFLVERKFLGRTGRGMYARLTDGRARPPLPQTTTADADVTRQEVNEAV